jgi:hypothetical protein
MNNVNITDASKAVFIAYAKDAGNWSGTPLVGGNVGGSKGERGNLTQLKRAGLINTVRDEGCIWIYFTDAGKAYAKELGIEYGFGEQS